MLAKAQKAIGLSTAPDTTRRISFEICNISTDYT